ncbi:hypothetical protein [Rufibacter tibetensis]|uniref:Outer membrane protein beta-barrel domain-containing protein n=1 Tax=Rufibacter tibetensis TaxID=512763 RepID=A0A0P0CLL9_9BACT|nr:hypothetical protein [Rufibacter tibetensis]ALI97730.1 hypothetical protein DC20_00385 [Rufibacter tibetensis]
MINLYKSTCLIFCFCLFINKANAQDYIIKNVESERIDDILALELSISGDTNIVFFKDLSYKDNRLKKQVLRNNSNLSAKSSYVNIWLQFLNPLVYKVNVETKEEVDEDLNNATSNFITALNATGALLAGLPSASGTNINTAFGDILKGGNQMVFVHSPTQLGQTATEIKDFKSLQNLETIELYLWLNSDELSLYSKPETKKELLNILISAEEAFMQNSFETTSLEVFEEMKGLKTIASLKDNLKDINGRIVEKEVTTSLAYLISSMETSIIDVTDKIDHPEEIINVDSISFSDPNNQRSFDKNKHDFARNLVVVHLRGLLKKYQDILAKRKKQQEELLNCYKKLEAYQNSNDWEGEYYQLIKSLPIDRKNFQTISLKINHLTFNKNNPSLVTVEEKSVINRNFSVKRIRNVILVASTGGFYTDVNYNQFSTANDASGNATIVKTKEEKDYFNFGAGLNLFPNIRNSHFLPGLQFGVAAGQNYPMFLSGLCFNLPDYNITFSIGGLLTWNRQLSEKKEGDIITGGDAELQNLIRWKFDSTPKLYLGLNFNINTKK